MPIKFYNPTSPGRRQGSERREAGVMRLHGRLDVPQLQPALGLDKEERRRLAREGVPGHELVDGPNDLRVRARLMKHRDTDQFLLPVIGFWGFAFGRRWARGGTLRPGGRTHG